MDTYSTILTPPTIPEPRKASKVGVKFIVATLLCIALGSFVLLTKMAIIPNYFDIEILYPVDQKAL